MLTDSDRPPWWPDEAAMTEDQLAEWHAGFLDLLGPLRLPYPPPFAPSLKQEVFLRVQGREAFYGGAAGPGKSSALLMAALQYCDVPGYSALILRRTLTDLQLEGALIDVSHEWLRGIAQWNGNLHKWSFPSGATLTFGYLKQRNAQYRYKSSEFQFIGFDEVTEFEEAQYLYMLSRLRRSKDPTRYPPAADGTRLVDVPLRMRAASNPGGPGHDWCYERFVDPDTRSDGVYYLPGLMTDNPGLDVEEYVKVLSELGEVERRQLMEGDWDAIATGGIFRPAKMRVVKEAPSPVTARVRWWDMAASGEDEAQGGDPDYTVALLLGLMQSGEYIIEDVTRGRWSPGETEEKMTELAMSDLAEYGRGGVEWWIGQEPGSSGKSIIPHYRKRAPGIVVRAKTETGDKVTRARVAGADSEHGKIWMRSERWVKALKRELAAFPTKGVHDDQVDALSGAHGILSRRQLHTLSGHSPARRRGQPVLPGRLRR